MPNPPFIPGLELCGLFYTEAVRPILDAHFPNLAHSAARLGSGSEVLGFDTPRSTDHGWGLRVDLYLSRADRKRYAGGISAALAEELPFTFRGYPTNLNFSLPYGWMEATDSRPIHHGVSVHTIGSFFTDYLGLDPRPGLGAVDWLTMPEQHLCTVASGRVYHDGLAALEPLRETLRYYPRDIWLYLLAAQWRWISEEEAFVGRAGDVGDELGSRIVAARLVRAIVKLCFLMERQYAPYSKWLGSAFARLACAPRLTPVLHAVLSAEAWREREAHLSRAYGIVAEMHNNLGITAPLPVDVSPFYDRPYQVIHADRFAEAIREQIADPEVRALPEDLGSVDQFADSTLVLSNVEQCRTLRSMYGKRSG